MLITGYLVIALLLAPLTAAAGPAGRVAGPPPAYLSELFCRLASRTHGPDTQIRPLTEAQLDTVSRLKARQTLSAQLPGGRTLTAVVRHVSITLPRERFNVTMLLDGAPHLRVNHLDLDIYIETTIDHATYLLHCFRDLEDGPVSGEMFR